MTKKWLRLAASAEAQALSVTAAAAAMLAQSSLRLGWIAICNPSLCAAAVSHEGKLFEIKRMTKATTLKLTK